MSNHLYEFGPFRVDPGKRRLLRDEVPVALNPKVFDLLLALIAHRGERLARSELLHNVWPDTAAGEQNLNQCVAVLRRALGDDPKHPEYIATLPGYGYSFISDVQVIGNGAVSPQTHPSRIDIDIDIDIDRDIGSELAKAKIKQFPRPVPYPAAPDGEHAPKRWFRPALILTFVITGLASGLCVYLVRHWHGPTQLAQSSKASSAPVRKSVAVLGFDNLSQRPSDAWLSTALSEMLSTEIGAGGKLRTIPGESIARARADLNVASLDGLSNATLRKIQKELGADLIVSGSYALIHPSGHKGEEIRVDVQVQDAGSGRLVATGETAGNVADLFSLVRRAGSQLRQDLGVNPMSTGETVQTMAAMPANLEAARLYAKGLSELHNFNPLAARGLLERTTTLDPAFPLAYFYLSRAYESLGEQTKGINDAKKAFDLSGHLTRELQLQIQAQYAQSQSNWVKARQVYLALWTFFPDDLDYGLGVANADIMLGKEADALRDLDRLRSLPPPLSDDPRIDLTEAALRGHLSDFQQGLAPARRAAALAQKRGERWLYARALQVQAGLLASLTNYQQAMPLDEQAGKICQSLGDLHCVADVDRRIGYMKVDSDPTGAQTALRKSLSIARRIGGSSEEEADLNGLAALLSSQGRLAEADQIYRQGLAQSRKAHDTFEIQMYLDNLGEDAIQQGNLLEARKVLEEAIAVSRKASQKVGIAFESMDLGRIAELRGNLAEAVQHYQLAKTEFRQIGIPSGIAWADSGLAAVSRKQGNFAMSERQFKTALSLFSPGTDDGEIADADLGLAKLRIAEGHGSDAVALATRSLVIFARQGRSSDEALATVVLAQGHLLQGRFRRAGSEALQAESMVAVTQNRLAQLAVTTSAEQIVATLDERSNRPRLITDTHKLAREADLARLRGLTPITLEAELTINEIGARSGSRAALTHLKQLETEAQSHGLASIAHRAETATAEIASERSAIRFRLGAGER